MSDVAVSVAVAERNVCAAFGRFAVPGRRNRPSDRHLRPSDPNIRKKSGRDPPPSPVGV